MRRLSLLAFFLILATATSASASFQPIRRDHGETTLPRLRAGVLHIPAAHTRGRITVIVRLSPPPLAAWNADRSLSSAQAARRLDASSAASRTYLARIDATQRAAVAQLHRAIPQAQVDERYRVVLDGFAVRLPVKKLPQLVRLGFATKVYPSISYSVATDRSPSVIEADALEAATGVGGDGVKIGVVDTGVDWKSPFLAATGYSYPAGFPKGDKTKTSPKVIVARNFPAPVTDAPGRRAFDPTEPHGTHVAGIAAGDVGTNAPAGPDHPATSNLSGVAPRAYIGNYRVFNVPTPLGHLGNTPQIVAAFEQAVLDGMDVINFSGGGPQTDPINDAMYETVKNVAAAGVVPVISAGNDRDEFGLGSAGSPGTAPDAISVAAVSNRHVFDPALTVVGGPASVGAIPVASAGGQKPPAGWGTLDQTLVDVSSVLGTDRKAVDPYLCGTAAAPNGAATTLPGASLRGAIVLAQRGRCTFVSKAARARKAGAAGLILVDNRSGEANGIPVQMSIPGGMIADLDGQRLRAYLASTGGRAKIRVSSDVREIETDRSGIITSFSSAGPTSFDHALKPDLSAPGLAILSSTPPATTGSTFSVFDGTSMAAPHVSGAAALLVQRHPEWAAWQVKSALMSTAGPAWGNTARTEEAPVWLEGAGLANVAAADDPQIFTDPQSLSYGDVDVAAGAQRRALLLTISDAGDGAGTWSVELRPQAQAGGVSIQVPGSVDVAPGGDVAVPVVIRAAADAGVGLDNGFVVLRRGAAVRRVPYGFFVQRPVLRDAPVTKLQKLQVGNTAAGDSRVAAYCCPSAPFGPAPSYSGASMNENGAEHLYSVDLEQPVSNFGVSVLSSTGLVDPWVLGSKNENDVQGYSGTPVNINNLMYDANVDVGAAGAQYPKVHRFYVAVDSRADPFTGRSLKGRYLLNAWVDDVTPPAVRMLTTRVAAGRPLLVAQAVDSQSGIDPLSIVIQYGRALLGATAYDPVTGVILFGVPRAAPKLVAGRVPAVVMVSDYQETKNINTPSDDVYPNTTFRGTRIRVLKGPAVTWVLPFGRTCVDPKTERLVVTGNSTTKPTRVVFRADGNQIGVDRSGPGGVFSIAWKTASLKKGNHHLLATLVDRSGRTDTAGRTVRRCR